MQDNVLSIFLLTLLPVLFPSLANIIITGLEKPAIETSLYSVKALFEINVYAVMEMNNAFLPLLLASKGVIVNHGSMVRSLAHPFTAAYNASKAAVSQYSNTLRIELEPLGVRVVELVSGRVATGLITVPELSDGSVYKPLEPTLQARAREAGLLCYHKIYSSCDR